MQVEAFIDKKSDFSDAPGAWHAYQNILRMYTEITLTAWENGREAHETMGPLLAQESSQRSMRHVAMIGPEKQVMSKSEIQVLATVADQVHRPGRHDDAQTVMNETGTGHTTTLRPSPTHRRTKINYCVNEEDLEARMDTQL